MISFTRMTQPRHTGTIAAGRQSFNTRLEAIHRETLAAPTAQAGLFTPGIRRKRLFH